ncbi:site-specific DNA-methyltransferase [Cellulomonas bogoriensis]|uniref:DNA methyltransferase n=1 Tax=Cellulomonas bogoriensis 69B4 = DSM 16987 TaxID=1386082 RepID=A0A0A0C1B1_9CELL|nr:site-specific DNA-methyltransferase [Cellulomonas bogoriensis]KGM14433.1 DNA methyltransferase [Cellulomonas bogoriensis 69B4 = DSM 16987]
MTDEIHETPSSTPNFRTELAAQLADLVPEAVADGKVDVEKLKELLDGDAADSSERFGLFWPGKKRALRAAQEPTTATLRPDFENSKDWDTTQNVFIEGDNLEVLKILQKHYHAKIKMIYIDPPYNTGKDFVYPDNYKEGLETYLEWTRQVNEEGKKLSTNAETEGRYHSNWLNMMYPRLKLARNLLRDDGVLFVSIDDNEVANLRRALDEIFGESNFIENYIWESSFRPDNSSRLERENAQHILCYARNKSLISGLVGAQKVTEGLPSLTKSSMRPSTLALDPDWVEFQLSDGKYEAGPRPSGYTLETDVTVVEGRATAPFRLTGRVIWSQNYLEKQVSEGTRIVIKGESFVPYSRKVTTSALAPTTLVPRDHVGDVLAGAAEIRGLFGARVFNHPKPTTLLSYLINSVTSEDPDAVVLDFFAGSASTAHAVLALNASASRKCRFIVVQLPEPTPPDSVAASCGYDTIAEVARKRIDLAGAELVGAVHGQEGLDGTFDVGFRAYKLADSNFPKWRVSSDVEEGALQQHLLSLRDSAADDATADELLTELLLKQGYSLTETVSPFEVGGLDVRLVRDRDGDIAVMAYLNEHVKPTLEQLRALVDEAPARIIVLEDAFQGDDELKTNVAQLCKSNGIELWTA